MENEYAIEAFGKTFSVIFEWQLTKFNRSKMEFCAIVEFPEKKIYSGASIFNPHDIYDRQVGRRWAFKRAVLNLWMIWTELKTTNHAYKPFWQTFRKALAANELYLKDRKEG